MMDGGATSAQGTAGTRKDAHAMDARHVRLDKVLRLKNPSAFMARERSIIEEAFAGDS